MLSQLYRSIRVATRTSNGNGSRVLGLKSFHTSNKQHAGMVKHERGVFPSVRRLLDEYSINAKDVTPTGPLGRVLKGDVLAFITQKGLKKSPVSHDSKPAPSSAAPTTSTVPKSAASPAAATTPAAANNRRGPKFVDQPASSMRRVIAQRLTESKSTIPHVYLTEECVVDKLMALRKQLAAQDIKVSVNDFIVKAAAVALTRVPEANVSWNLKTQELIQHKTVDVSVAVSLDTGLITPIIKNASGKGVAEISANMRDLADRARTNKLLPHEFQGGTFSVSNLGMFGISEFTAVINPPQACIMAVGGIQQKLDLDVEKGVPQVRNTIKVALSYDGRAVNDEHAAQFLDEFKRLVSEPTLLIV
jgi:pyruvate dehydrogenase complex dihydrolipoamide acetyltransferase long form